MPLVKGFCHEDFKAAKDLFESNFLSGEDENAQICVYIGNQLVMDLWGVKCENNAINYGPDSLQVVYSCGKNATALVVGMMVDKNLLSYESKVQEYWPEFGSLGKEEITLADIMRHEGGLDHLDHTFVDCDFSRESIKQNCVGSWLEKEYAHWDNQAERCRAYHTITRGWILNEIVRRVDPTGRTIGEIFHDEVMQEGMFCGLPENQAHLVVPQQARTKNWLLGQSMLPSFVSDKVDYNLMDILWSMMNDTGKRWLKTTECLSGVQQDQSQTQKHWQKDHVRKNEHPSANFNGSARGLARVAHIMANNGVDPDGKSILSHETCKTMHEDPKIAYDVVVGYRTAFTKGGFNHFKRYENPNMVEANTYRDGWYGWYGYGGVIMQWHPTLKIAFGYAQTNVRWYDRLYKIGGKLQKSVLDCHIVRPLSTGR